MVGIHGLALIGLVDSQEHRTLRGSNQHAADTIPDLFPGAVAQGLVAQDIGWLTSFKLALFLAVISSIVAGMRGTGENE